MPQNALTLTLVIPAYNEERHLKACLDGVARQTIMPDEVIVVDNNSRDKTAEIAKSYRFVTLLEEKHQGRGHARTRGFNAATSDILGRIDADSVIDPDWVERVLADFALHDVDSVTGLGVTNLLPHIIFIQSTFWSRVYFWMIHAYFGANTMWGANCAIRRSAWLRVRDDVCLDDRQVHEDQDVSLLIAGTGGEIKQDNKLLIRTHGQSYLFLPKLLYYGVLRARTRKRHKALGTLARPEARLLSFWSTLPGRVYAAVAGIFFLVISVVLWPFDAMLLAYRRELGKPWLD